MLKKLDADVIALQEVASAEWARKIFGDDYRYYFSSRNHVQKVGFAVKKSEGFSVVDAVDYAPLGLDGSVRYGKDLTLKVGDQSIRLLGVHLKSLCFDKPLDAATKDCKKLNKQVEPLESWINQRAEEALPFVVLGDFNRRFNVEVKKGYSSDIGIWPNIDDSEPNKNADLSFATEGRTSTCWDGKYKEYIDHIVFDARSAGLYKDDSFNVLSFEGEFGSRSRLLSDHCAMSVDLDI